MSEVKKTITAVTKATGAFTKVAAEIQKQLAGFETVASSLEILGEEIEYKQQQLDLIEQEISDAQRKANAELKIRILEDEDGVVEGILNSRGLTTIAPTELQSLRNELTKAEYDNEDAVNSAVAVQVKKGQAELASSLSAAKSKYEVDSATDKATITMLTTQLADARETNVELKSMLNEERSARVEIAKAGTNISLSTPSK